MSTAFWHEIFMLKERKSHELYLKLYIFCKLNKADKFNLLKLKKKSPKP